MRSISRAITRAQVLAAVLSAAAIIAVPVSAQTQKPTAQGAWGGKTNGAGHYANVNGIRLYYETHGTGKPLILLHGGLGAIEMFGPNLPALGKGRQLIAVDLQGHGRTADIDRPLTVELMADDIAALIRHFKLQRPDIMGYSMGGGSPSRQQSGTRTLSASSWSSRLRSGATASTPTFLLSRRR